MSPPMNPSPSAVSDGVWALSTKLFGRDRATLEFNYNLQHLWGPIPVVICRRKMVFFGLWIGFTRCTLHRLPSTGSSQYVHNHCDVFSLGNPRSHHPFHSDPKHHSRTLKNAQKCEVANQMSAFLETGKSRPTLKTAKNNAHHENCRKQRPP